MGIRINKAIGWGTKRLDLIPEYDEMVSKFSVDQLVMQVGSKSDIEFNVLNPYGGKSGNGDPKNLWRFIGDTDETDGIIFFPDSHCASRWFRHDDDIDYALSNTEDGCGTTKIEELSSGIFPYTGYMDKNGNTVKEGFMLNGMFLSEDGLKIPVVPSVPRALRWYLKELGVMTDQQITDHIRPMTAEWWC